MSNAMSSANTYISVGDGSSPISYTEIGEIRQIGGPNETSEEIDVTHLRSPGRRREYIQSFLNAGELPLTANWLPTSTSHQTLKQLYGSGEVRGWKINYPNGAVQLFHGFVKAVGSTAQVGNAVEGNFTIRITGDVALHPNG